jgi:excisionase family DNA binding protein
MIAMPEKLTKPLYSINEAKDLLGVSDETIRRMIHSQQLDAVKVRGQWRIRRESLEKYLGKQEDK